LAVHRAQYQQLVLPAAHQQEPQVPTSLAVADQIAFQKNQHLTIINLKDTKDKKKPPTFSPLPPPPPQTQPSASSLVSQHAVQLYAWVSETRTPEDQLESHHRQQISDSL
jgi:hypothetical protein